VRREREREKNNNNNNDNNNNKMTSFNVFVRLVNSTRTRCYQLSDDASSRNDHDDYKKGEGQNILLNRLKALVETREGIPRDAQVFLSVETTFFLAKSEGEKRDAASSASGSSSSSSFSSFSSLDEENFLSRRKRIEPNGTYQLFLKKGLQGGKGGFGTLLRSTGKKKGRNSGANNNELCRDLRGQRYHVTENAKKMEQWEKEESLREEEALALRYIEEQTGEKARKRAKMEEEEERFRKDSEEVKERMERAIKMATNATKISTTLASSSVEKRSKRDEEEDDDNEEEEEEDDDEDDFRKKKKKTSTTKNDRGEKEKEEERKEEEKPKEVEEKEQRKEEKVAASEKKLSSAATSSSPPKQENFEPIDLSVINTAQELERFGLDHLKIELTRQKLKCGGSLEERANRLFLLKTNSLEEIDKKHKAKK
jgi:hypothetical protein